MQTQLINFTIPKPLLNALDKQAQKEVKTRSEILRDAVRNYLGQKQAWQQAFSYGQKRAKKLDLKPDQVEDAIDQYRQGK